LNNSSFPERGIFITAIFGDPFASTLWVAKVARAFCRPDSARGAFKRFSTSGTFGSYFRNPIGIVSSHHFAGFPLLVAFTATEVMLVAFDFVGRHSDYLPAVGTGDLRSVIFVCVCVCAALILGLPFSLAFVPAEMIFCVFYSIGVTFQNLSAISTFDVNAGLSSISCLAFVIAKRVSYSFELIRVSFEWFSTMSAFDNLRHLNLLQDRIGVAL